MNKFAALLVLGLALGPSWQDPNPEELRANPEMQRQEIINLENEAAHAIQLNNATFFRRVYADDFSGTLSHGQPVNKTTFIEAVQSPDIKYESFSASDIAVRLYQNTAVVTCLWSSRSIFKGQRVSSQMRTMHVYINGPRGWKVIAGQATLLPPGAQLPL